MGDCGGRTDVDQETGVSGLVSAGERNLRRGRASARASNGELGARNVELSAGFGTGTVETNVLNAHEVVTGGGVLGKGEGEVGDAVTGPLETVIGNLLDAHLVDLEPAIIALGGGNLAGLDLGEVDLEGTRVANGGVERETDLGTRSNLLGLGGSTAGKTTGIADNFIGGDVGDGGVGVGIFAESVHAVYSQTSPGF